GADVSLHQDRRIYAAGACGSIHGDWQLRRRRRIQEPHGRQLRTGLGLSPARTHVLRQDSLRLVKVGTTMTRRQTLPAAGCAVLFIACSSAVRLHAQAAAQAQVPATLRVMGDVRTPLSIAPGELKSWPRTNVEVKDEDGRTLRYEGVLVGEILKRAGATVGA